MKNNIQLDELSAIKIELIDVKKRLADFDPKNKEVVLLKNRTNNLEKRLTIALRKR